MSSVIPGVDGFPMGAATKLRGADLCMVEKLVSDITEPRRIEPRAGRSSPNIRVSHVALNFGHLFGVQHKSAIRVTSPPINIFQIMVPLSGKLVCARDLVAGPGTALVYAPRERLDTSWSDDCVALVLSISTEKVAALARATFPGLEPGRMPSRSLMMLSHGSGRSFAHALGAICQESVDPNSAFSRGITTRSLEEVLLLSLLLSLTRRSDDGLPTTGAACSVRRSYVARALDYVEAHLDAHLADAITLTDLIRASGASARTLQYGFMEQFGVGPMTYLKRQRMHRVHDALREAWPGSVSVGDIAAQWGFYNGSAFARVYRRMFGELPSETLSRRQPQ